MVQLCHCLKFPYTLHSCFHHLSVGVLVAKITIIVIINDVLCNETVDSHLFTKITLIQCLLELSRFGYINKCKWLNHNMDTSDQLSIDSPHSTLQ